jgi:hypothetical protein
MNQSNGFNILGKLLNKPNKETQLGQSTEWFIPSFPAFTPTI